MNKSVCSTNDHAFREAARVIQEVADVRKRDASFAEAYRVIQDIESNRYSDNRYAILILIPLFAHSH